MSLPHRDCPICLESLSNREVSSLGCSDFIHSFHSECISQWFNHQKELAVTPACPLCRKQYPKAWAAFCTPRSPKFPIPDNLPSTPNDANGAVPELTEANNVVPKLTEANLDIHNRRSTNAVNLSTEINSPNGSVLRTTERLPTRALDVTRSTQMQTSGATRNKRVYTKRNMAYWKSL
ncbi:hypothetical protein PGTUg99_005093 [Puccinia graminis f. sp. tritici]|uniref:RING-type domain-containing protein n=1 Tax=Puccinia graminis f. sp. tritici TaxID=56615 RepID=A0A5B0NTK7_PUCGR|nr:hypothetical protein PGTUg99_005093 [Puccinia graminis f. sp. tritici]